MLMKFTRNKVLITIFLILLFSPYTVYSIAAKFEPDPEFESEIPLVKGYRDKMLRANVFIFNAEEVPEKISSEDRLDSWQSSLIIYRTTLLQKKLKRKVLTMKKLKFLCGMGKFCSLDEFYSKVTSDKLNIPDMREKLAKFVTLVSGKTCFADLYDWKAKNYGVVVCMKAEDNKRFEELFKSLNPGDFKDEPGKTIPASDIKTIEINISDGSKIIQKKQATFDKEGIKFDGQMAIFYNSIEPYEGDKCKVKYESTIIPARFIEIGLFNPKCVVSFYYNKMKIYFGSVGENCPQVATYMLKKMSQSCLRAINGPSNTWKTEIASNPLNGRWKGYIFYHKVLDNGGTVNPLPYKVNISETEFKVTDPYGGLVADLKFRDFNWYCNDDFGCTVDYYIKYLVDNNIETKQRDFKAASEKLVSTWRLQDYNACWVLEDRDIHIFCPTDLAEEGNIKTAIAVSMDMQMKNSDLKGFRTAKSGSKFTIIYTLDSTNTFEETEVVVSTRDIVTKKNKKKLVDFKFIKEFSGIPCGIEVRNDSLPAQLHEIRPNCCARLKTDENFFFCITPPSKCYKRLREMVNLVREGCLVAQGYKDSVALATKFAGSAWTGNVVFMLLDNFKTKGMNSLQKGTMSVSIDKIRFESDKEKYEFKTETSNFICGKGSICSLNDYVDLQQPFLQAETDENWFKMQIQILKDEGQNTVDTNTDCYVYVSKNEESGDSSALVTCATDKLQVPNMVASIINAFAKKLESIPSNNPDFLKIPTSYTGRDFKAWVISGNSSTDISTAKPKENKIQIIGTGLKYQPSNDVVFNFIDIVFDDKEKYKYGLEENVTGIPPGMKEKNVNPLCCFKASTQSGNFWFVCYSEFPLCVYQKMTTVRFISENLAGAKKKKEKKTDDDKKKLSEKPDDPFDFGIKIPYKSFSKNYNIGDLLLKNFDNSSNGFWSGWGYHMPLTSKRPLKIKPVYLEIGNGFVIVKPDEDKVHYLKIPMNQFEGVCGDEPCSPKKYLDFYSKVNSYADQAFLEKTINSCLSQMYRPFRSEACMVMDFTEPQLITGFSHMFCAMDSLQGESLINAVKTNYYISLLNIDVDTEVRKVVWGIDKYNASLFIDEKYQEKYNTFKLTKDGIEGTNEDKENPNPQSSLNKGKWTMTYASVSPDLYGDLCGFWYKDLKISGRSEDVAENVYDDNCCFRMYKTPTNEKIEICVFDYELKVCIKRMKELMKGMQDGCMAAKTGNGGGPNSAAQTEFVADEFSLNTLDDSKNGVWYGYAYIGPVFSPSIIPTGNPYFVKITTNWLSIFKDHKSQDPFQSIQIDALEFKCPEFSACRVNSFMKRIQVSKRYSSQVGNVKTVIQTYKDKLTDIRPNFDKVCSVLETNDNAYILCPYNPNHAKAINKAVVRAYTLHHACKKIPTVHDANIGKVWDIAYMFDSVKRKKVYISQKGLIDKASDTVFVEFQSLDNDPITNSRCAVWIKEVPLAFNFPRQECCFMLSIKSKPLTICLEKKGVCVGDTYKLVKQIWNGCMFGQPKVSSDIISKINYRDDICPSLRTKQLFDPKELVLDYNQDMYQDIIYSVPKSLYKGWVNIYPLELDKELPVVAKALYGILTPESFKFFNDRDTKKPPVMNVRPDMLSFTCGKLEPCFPLEFLTHYTKNFNPGFSYYNYILSSRIDQFEGSKESGCAVLEYNVNGTNNYMTLCPNIINDKTEVQALQKKMDTQDYVSNRGLLSLHYGKILRKVIFDSYAKAMKFTLNVDLPKFDKPITHIKLSFQEMRTEHDQVKVTADGVYAGSVQIFQLKDMTNCRVRFNLIYAPKDIIQNKKPQCCLRFRGIKYAEYICIKSPTCEVDAYRMAYNINNNCKRIKNLRTDDVFNEFNAGDNVDTKFMLKQIEKSQVIGDIPALNPGGKLSTDEYKVKFRSLLYKYLSDAKEFLNDVLKQLVETGSRVDGSQDTLPDQTPPEDPKSFEKVKSFIPRWKGANSKYEFDVGKARATRFKNKTTGNILISINGKQIIKTKDYKLVLSQKDKYLMGVFNDDTNGMLYVELQQGTVKIWKDLKKTFAGNKFFNDMMIAEIDK